jgi:hypothetical protein
LLLELLLELLLVHFALLRRPREGKCLFVQVLWVLLEQSSSLQLR